MTIGSRAPVGDLSNDQTVGDSFSERLRVAKLMSGRTFKTLAVLDVDRAGFDAARFGDVARARAVDWNDARVASLAVISGNGRGLAQRFGARIFIRFRPEDHVAARNFIGMEPPVFGLRHFDAEIIVVGVRGADEQRPRAGKLVVEDAWFSRLLKKTHMLTSIALSFAEGCAQSPRVNVLPVYVSAEPAEGSILRAPRLWIFLSSLQEAFFQQPVRWSDQCSSGHRLLAVQLFEEALIIERLEQR